MNEAHAKEQMARIVKFRELDQVRKDIQAAINEVTQPWETGPSGQGPFTGNTRESRQIQYMKIAFTATRGGDAPVEVEIQRPHIEANDFGRALGDLLRRNMDLVMTEMEKI